MCSLCVCLLLLLFWAVCWVTGVCFRIVLGIITKKNILEHLEELKQHTPPLVTSPAPFTRDLFPHLFFFFLHLSLRLCLLGEGRGGCMKCSVKSWWQFPAKTSRLPALFLTSSTFLLLGLFVVDLPLMKPNMRRQTSLTTIFMVAVAVSETSRREALGWSCNVGPRWELSPTSVQSPFQTRASALTVTRVGRRRSHTKGQTKAQLLRHGSFSCLRNWTTEFIDVL